jgi:F420H(2)-dependent quinone reductase
VTTEPQRPASLPPRWFIRTFWVAQRAVYSVTRGRFGLRAATAAHQVGMMRLQTVGRRSGEERKAILAYLEDGPDLVTMAMNGWGDAEPAWWLNLQAHPDAVVDLPGGPRTVLGRAANAEERPRLWARWATHDKDLDAYAARRSRETAVVILSPRSDRHVAGRRRAGVDRIGGAPSSAAISPALDPPTREGDVARPEGSEHTPPTIVIEGVGALVEVLRAA